MRPQYFVMVFAAVAILSLFPLLTLLAQDSHSDDYEVIMSQLDELLKTAQGWSMQSKILRGSTILVAILGLIVSTLQKAKFHGRENAVLAFGLVIAALTLANSMIFDADYKTLKKNHIKARSSIMQAQARMAGYDTASEADQIIYRQMIIDLINNIAESEESMMGVRASLSLIPTAYAASQKPGPPNWISDPPKDRVNEYFSGKGENSSLAVARKIAYDKAVDNAIRQIKLLPADSTIAVDDPMREYFEKVSTVADTYFSYDRNKRAYDCYILLKASKKLVQPYFMKLFIEK